MDREMVESYIKHYSEQAYDPVKAHEYYMRNRELKGRTSGGLSELQKEAWSYSKNRIDTDKKQQVDANKEANDQKIEEFNKLAEETRSRIADKLKLFVKQLSDKAASESERIANKLEEDLANVAPIPKNINPKRRAFLLEKRNKEIAAIRKTSDKERSALNSDTKDSKQEITDSTASEKEKVKTDLKDILSKTKNEYAKAKDKLDSDYEEIYQKEYGKVLTTVAGKAPKVKKAPKPKAAPKAKKEPKAKEQKGIIYYNGKGPTR